MRLEQTTRLALIISATTIALVAIATAVLSGAEVDPERVISSVGTLLAGLVAGIGIAGGPSLTPEEQRLRRLRANGRTRHAVLNTGEARVGTVELDDVTSPATPLPRPRGSAGPLACLALALGASLAACGGGQAVDASACSRAVLEAVADVASACWPRSSAAEESCPIEDTP